MVKPFRWAALVGLVVVAGSSRTFAQGSNNDRSRDDHYTDHDNALHLSGSISDFTTPKFGSWTIQGVWSLNVTGGRDGAEFTAELTMERSDLFFVWDTAGTMRDPELLTTRNPHTHHIVVVRGTVTSIPGGFRVTGIAGETMITASGSVAPFEPAAPAPPTSTLQIDVTGGSAVTFSNITLTFGGAASGHFGSNPIAGVVRGVQ